VTPGTDLTVRLTPRATRDLIGGWSDDVLAVRVSAPPVDGKANAALIRILAAALEVPRARITLIAGQTSRIKRVRVEGMDEAELKRRLDARI
jgi:uncharacterized protein (TIGR00251 family)